MDDHNNCPFCAGFHVGMNAFENDYAFAIRDKFPVSEGHTLIVSKRHVSNYFDLSFDEQVGLMQLLNKVHDEIKNKTGVESYNIGININDAAGQTIPHVHIHLIPRSKGDVENPRGGIRNVIPGKGDY